jgi:hypothetical protein
LNNRSLYIPPLSIGRVFYGKVRYRVGLYDLAVRSLASEGVTDRVLIGQEAVSRDFRRADNALAKVLDELARVVAVALARHIGDDSARGRGQGDIGGLVAGHSGVSKTPAFACVPRMTRAAYVELPAKEAQPVVRAGVGSAASVGSATAHGAAIKPMSVTFNGDRLEISAVLSDAESVDRLIRALEANKPLLPDKKEEAAN